MSVINRMLLELDERHDSTAHHLPGMVRAVPARLPKPSYRFWFLGFLVFALVLLAAYFIWQSVVISQKSVAPISLQTPTAPILNSPLRLQPSVVLGSANLPPASDTEPSVQAIAAAPTPAPSTAVTPLIEAQKPATPSSKFLLPARDEPKQHTEKPKAGAPSETVSDDVTRNIKSISKEQQADFRYREALALIAQGRAPEAQAALEDALRVDPKNFAARQALLGQLLAAKRYAQAEQLLQDGLRLNIAIAAQASALASIQLERGDSAAALATLEKYAAPATGSADYHGMHAAMLQRAGRHAEAIQQFQAALKIQANQANWLMGLGISLQAEKRYADAEQAYTRARASPGLSADLQTFVEQRLQQVRQAH